MILQLSYQTKQEIPEGAASFYTEQSDGSFNLNVDGDIKTQDDIDRVKQALEKEREAHKETQKTVNKYKDIDLDKWEKVKDIDPDNPPVTGDSDPNTEKQIQKQVSEQVRQKERELKEKYDEKLQQEQAQLEQKETARNEQFKETWIKQRLAEKYGFTDQKKLRWLMLDVKSGQYPDIKNKIDSIDVNWDNGVPTVVGGELRDDKGALEVLENISNSDISADYKPAPDNRGGGANNTSTGSPGKNPYKKDNWNLTEQGRLEKEAPEEAKRLAGSAGINL